MFPNGPVEPTADVRVAARTMHEMFTAFTQEGFTRKEALELVKQMLLAGQQNNPQ